MTDAKKSEMLTSIADSVRSITDSKDKVSLATLPDKLAARDAELELFRYIEGKLGKKSSLTIPENYTTLKCSFAGSAFEEIRADGFTEVPLAFCVDMQSSSSSVVRFLFPNAEGVNNYAFKSAKIAFNSDFLKVKTIGAYAFEGASLGTYNHYDSRNVCIVSDEYMPALEEVTGFYAFRNAKGLSYGVSHSKLRYIYHGCFEGSDIASVSLPALTYCGSNAFRNCVSLTTVYLPLCSSISSTVFYGCTGIKEINLPNVSALEGSEVFCGCSSLEKIVFGGSSSSGYIGKDIIKGCTNLKALVFEKNTKPPQMLGLYFDNSPVTDGDCYIYVPDSAVSAYKAATNWSVYADRIKKLSEYTG